MDNPGEVGLYSKSFYNSWSEAGLEIDSKAPRKNSLVSLVGLIIGAPSNFYSLSICPTM